MTALQFFRHPLSVPRILKLFHAFGRIRGKGEVNLKKIFCEYKEGLSQCAIAWLLHQEAVTSVLVGPRILNQFLDNIRGAESEDSAPDL